VILVWATVALIGVTAFGQTPADRQPTRLPPITSGPQVESPGVESPSTPSVALQPEVRVDLPLDWWSSAVTQPVLESPQWVSFDLDTILLDTLAHSPQIQSVSHRTSVAMEKIVQQDAVFDPTLLLETNIGRTNDPVGNTLTTGGPPRLIEESLTASAGVRRTTRTGTVIDLAQEIGIQSSNSQFFDPVNQGNARLSLSLVKPLRAGSGRLYNERLLTQARIDGNISWSEMRADVEQRIFEVINAYWQLYQRRCHVMQQDRLIERGLKIQELLEGRDEFDASRIEIAKARQRTARRTDQRLLLTAELAIEQARLAALVGSEHLLDESSQLEFIPLESPQFPELHLNLRDAVLQGIENRPEVRTAAADLESAALSIHVTRNELLPNISAVVDTYVAGLNGSHRVGASLVDQLSDGGPGISAGLQYEMPRGRRAALSRHREAHHRYQQRSEELRETVRRTRLQIETALIVFNRTVAQQSTKRQLLLTAIEEEEILTRRWEMMAGDGGNVGTVLETLLDAQQRRTDAEREWVTAQSEYLIAFVDLQRAMGTLLMHEGITPMQTSHCGSAAEIEFLREQSIDASGIATSQPELNAEPLTEKVNQP
tara:strand:- start:549764 stop:551566 length:1803 start_codon:yes stop_codon:yes gene_type:complete